MSVFGMIRTSWQVSEASGTLSGLTNGIVDMLYIF